MSDPIHIDLPEAVTELPLHLSVDPWWNLVTALEFGAVSDGLCDEQRLTVEDTSLVYVLREPEVGPIVGFEVWEWDEFELPDDEPEIWDGPRFSVPRLGLQDASAGEIVLAVRAQFGNDPTADALHFHAAIQSQNPEDALDSFELALDAGEMKAHYGLGYTLVEMGQPQRAYAHLRRYTELVPMNAWGWRWLGECCEALGERAEAIIAYHRAIEAEEACGMETDADERLEHLLAS